MNIILTKEAKIRCLEMLWSLLPSSTKTPNMGRLVPAAQTVPDDWKIICIICVTLMYPNYCYWNIQPIGLPAVRWIIQLIVITTLCHVFGSLGLARLLKARQP